jgi:methylglyoxal synthase
MKAEKTIALVAHDNCKKDLIEWARWNAKSLLDCQLVCTGTTGKLIDKVLTDEMTEDHQFKRPIIFLKSGPIGGDQQLGSMIVDGKIDILIFFWDPMEPHPHDVDVKALLRIAVLYNIPTACNRSTADFVISSHLMGEEYQPLVRDYSDHIDRELEL